MKAIRKVKATNEKISKKRNDSNENWVIFVPNIL
jgi:hypothetical protein